MQENSMNIDNSDVLDLSPPPVISSFRFGSKQLLVARDDLLPGGSKQRGAMPYLRSLIASGCTHFVYASPFCGFAQVTLSFCCSKLREFGAKSTIYCEKSPQGDFSELSYLAQSYGSEIILCESLVEAHNRSLGIQPNNAALIPLGFSITIPLSNDAKSNNTAIIPLGFDDPFYREFLKCEIKKHWQTISAKYNISELWLPIGSGTLLKIFKEIVPNHIKIYGVNVNVLPETDPRISTIMQDERVIYIRCKKKFHEAQTGTIPVPSNIFYDAKVFAEVKKTSGEGAGVALWWNVAR